MDWFVQIPDAVLGRLSWQELETAIEAECDELEKTIKLEVKRARRKFGLDVGEADDGPSPAQD